MNLSDKIRSLGLGRLMTGLAAFQSKLSGVMMLGKQMADGILVGSSKSMDTTLTTVGSETQTHEICAPVQTLVVGSESRVPEEEPKLVVKTDLGFQVKRNSVLCQRMCSRSGEPLCSRQAEGKAHLICRYFWCSFLASAD